MAATESETGTWSALSGVWVQAMTPQRPTEEFIRGQISFYESGYQFYRDRCQEVLASWSKLQADHWRARLSASAVLYTATVPAAREAGDGE
jgi:hypothetical protein